VSSYQRMLRVGGYLNFAVALAHIVLFLGMFFAMDQFKPLAGIVGVHVGPSSGGWVPLSGGWVGWIRLLLMVAGVAAFVSLLGLYGLSGAGRIRRLPLLRTGLIFTAVLFTFHGAYHLAMVGKYEALDAHPLFALIPVWKLTIGILYLVGTVGLWKTLAVDKNARPLKAAPDGASEP